MWNELKGGCAVLIGFVALALIVILVWQIATAVNEARPETQALRAEQAQHEAAMNRIREQEAAGAAERAATFWRGILNATVVGANIVLAGVPLAALIVLALFAFIEYRNRRDFVTVESVPVARQLAAQGATVPMAMMQVELHGQAAIEAARNPVHQLPPTLRTYSPRYGNHHAPRRLEPPPVAPQLPTPAEAPRAVTP